MDNFDNPWLCPATRAGVQLLQSFKINYRITEKHSELSVFYMGKFGDWDEFYLIVVILVSVILTKFRMISLKRKIILIILKP